MVALQDSEKRKPGLLEITVIKTSAIPCVFSEDFCQGIINIDEAGFFQPETLAISLSIRTYKKVKVVKWTWQTFMLFNTDDPQLSCY